MSKIRAVCVYCGSGPGTNPAYEKAADDLGRVLAEQNVRLVYGGGSLGLMGTVARSVLRHDGKVTGIIPDFLVAKERMLRDVDDLVVTEDMHARKRLMFERSDAFVALPGGLGTLEETVEMLTWGQLGRHRKPVLIANIEGFWNPLVALIEHMENQQFIRAGMKANYLVVDTVEGVVPALSRELASTRDEDAGAPSLSNL